MKKNLLLSAIFVLLLHSFSFSQTLQWAKQMGGTLAESGTSITVDNSGNVYTTGSFQGTVDFDPGPGIFNLTSVVGNDDIFISKLDGSGNFMWAKRMGGTGVDIGYSIAVNAGNVYTTGYFSNTADFDPGAGVFNLSTAGGIDIFISKLDTSGNFIWAKSMGGTGSDYGNSIAVDAWGNIYTTGYFYGTSDFDPGVGSFILTSAGFNDIFISKLDTSGNFIWAKSMGGTGYDYGKSIAVDSGNVYTTGLFSGTVDFDPDAGIFNLSSAGGSTDIFVCKLDTSGNFIWAKSMGGTGYDYGNSIAVDSGNVYTTGGFFSSTSDFDPGTGVFNLTSAGGNDIFISKLDSGGNFLLVKRMGGTGYDYGNSIAVDSGNVYTIGSYEGTSDFDPDTGIFNLVSAGGSVDIFISKLDGSGNFLLVQGMGDTGDDEGYSIAVNAGNVYTTGYFSGTTDFDPSAGVFNLISVGGYDIFVARYSFCSFTFSEICLVTVDSLSQNNIIVWDKPLTAGIDSFIIYRDTANNNYARIGAVPYGSLSHFIDTVRTLYLANGDPNASSWRYKIAVLDTCGTLSPMSPYHQSLFMINNGGTFIWTHYQIEGQNIPVPGLTNYIFQRDDNSTGNYSNVISLSASSTLYNDPQFANYPNASYRVMTQWSTQCTATKSSVDYNSSRSNVKGIAAPGIIKEHSLENVFSIYPNPNDGTFTIELLSSGLHLPASLTIYNVLGEIVYQKLLPTYSAPITLKQPAGIYNVQMETEKGIFNHKIIIE